MPASGTVKIMNMVSVQFMIDGSRGWNSASAAVIMGTACQVEDRATSRRARSRPVAVGVFHLSRTTVRAASKSARNTTMRDAQGGEGDPDQDSPAVGTGPRRLAPAVDAAHRRTGGPVRGGLG